jgi:hypothetical protein
MCYNINELDIRNRDKRAKEYYCYTGILLHNAKVFIFRALLIYDFIFFNFV